MSPTASLPEPAAPPPAWRVETAVALLIGVCVLLTFSPSFSAGWQTHWDDDWNFLRNPSFRGLGLDQVQWAFTTFHHGPYQPLSWLSLSLDCVLWGTHADGSLDPSGFHRTNVLLHALNGGLALLVVRRVLSAAGIPARRALIAAALGALFFAVHPLRVESVAWITERRDVLSGAFFLAAVWMHLRWVSTGQKRFIALCTACFAASLLSKATGVMLPFALVVLDVYPLRRERSWTALFLEKTPLFLAAIAVGLLAVYGQAQADTLMLERGALDRLAQTGYGLSFYLGKTLVPVGLLPLYELELAEQGMGLWPGFVVAVVVTIGAVLVRRRFPAVTASWCAFVLLALPILGVAQAGIQVAADRYTYLPALALSLLVAGVFAGRRTRPAHAALALLPLAFLAVAARTQTRLWNDSGTLWEHAVAVAPESGEARLNLAQFLVDAKRPAEAERHVAHYVTSIRDDDALAWNEYGLILAMQGRVLEAVPKWQRAIELDPELELAQTNLREARRELGDRFPD